MSLPSSEDDQVFKPCLIIFKSCKCEEPPNQPIRNFLSLLTSFFWNCGSEGSIALGNITTFLLNLRISFAKISVVVVT